MKRIYAVAMGVALLCGGSAAAMAQMANPLVADSRIKTLVYSENDVFPLVTFYGYQSNIEFGRNETIRTISVGDQVAWQIIPNGRYLFIRAMHDSARTNMTVITSKRTYQFDLISRPGQPGDGALSYVIRFYYPGEGPSYAAPAASYAPAMTMGAAFAPAMAAAPVAPVSAMPMAAPMMAAAPMPSPMLLPASPMPGGMNVDYTLTGPDRLAPVRVYDDGNQTFLEFSHPGIQPSIFVVENEKELPVPVQRTQSGGWMVPVVASRLTIREGEDLVCVFNESRLRQAQTMGN